MSQKWLIRPSEIWKLFSKPSQLENLLFGPSPRQIVHSCFVILPSDLMSQNLQKCLAHTLFLATRFTILRKFLNSRFFKTPFLQKTIIQASKKIIPFSARSSLCWNQGRKTKKRGTFLKKSPLNAELEVFE